MCEKSTDSEKNSLSEEFECELTSSNIKIIKTRSKQMRSDDIDKTSNTSFP